MILLRCFVVVVVVCLFFCCCFFVLFFFFVFFFCFFWGGGVCFVLLCFVFSLKYMNSSFCRVFCCFDQKMEFAVFKSSHHLIFLQRLFDAMIAAVIICLSLCVQAVKTLKRVHGGSSSQYLQTTFVRCSIPH